MKTFTDLDVLCGRGNGLPKSHVGTMNYRSLVKANLGLYARCVEKDKQKITQGILDAVRTKGGRFLRYDPASKNYVDIGDKEAKKKIAQAILDTKKKPHEMSLPVSIVVSCVDWSEELPQEFYSDYSKREMMRNGKQISDSNFSIEPSKVVDEDDFRLIFAQHQQPEHSQSQDFCRRFLEVRDPPSQIEREDSFALGMSYWFDEGEQDCKADEVCKTLIKTITMDESDDNLS